MAPSRAGLNLNASLLGALAALAVIAAAVHGVADVVPQTLFAVATAGGLDVAIRRTGSGVRRLPSGALVSGLIVALLLPAGQTWYVPVGAAALAIGAKHVLRWRGRNVFNPAAFGVAAAVFMFADPLRLDHAGYLEAGPRLYYAQSHLQMEGWSFLLTGGHGWTGSTSAVAVIVLGVVLVHRLGRAELVAGFLAAYAALFAVLALLTGHDLAVRLQLEVFATGVPFFAFFMLTDPTTSPRTRQGRALFGAGTALAAFLFRLVVNPVQFLLFALLAANLTLRALDAASSEHVASPDRSVPAASVLPFGP